MKKIYILIILLTLLILGTSCERSGSSGNINIVSQFVYDGMSNFYLWAEEVSGKKPTVNDSDPEAYFYKILNNIDTEHDWSWITDDISSLLSGFEGESTDAFGFQPFSLYTDDNKTSIVGLIRYVFPGTPAEMAGLERGEIIAKINGQTITNSNYLKMYGANTATTFTVLDKDFKNPRDVTITPARINTDPVLFTKIFDEYVGHKIGYLFYTNFIANYNESLYNAFNDFKAAGVTDLVIDLRYNPGGGITAATYLASLLAPESNVQDKDIFTIMSYNKFVNAAYDSNKWDRNNYLGDYDESKFSDPITANLKLERIYIIATRHSASASELLTFCLASFMEVVHIGEITSGKYTASWTIHAYDNFEKNGSSRAQTVYKKSDLTTDERGILVNWGMQPIVGRYTDKNNKDFIATNGLIPKYPIETQEYNTATWVPIGDPNDYLLSKAISLITGQPLSAAATESFTRSAQMPQLVESGLHSEFENIVSESVIIDNPKLLPAIIK